MTTLNATAVGVGPEVTQTVATPSILQDKPAPPAIEPQKAVARDAFTTANQTVESQFSVDPNTHETVVRVVNAETQEVISELPPEAILKLRASLDNLIGKQMDVKV